MASLIRIWQTRYTLNGKRVPASTPGASKVREKSSKWYGTGIPGKGSKRFPLASNKTVAQKMLNELVEDAERELAGMASNPINRGPVALADLLDQFIASREAKGTSPVQCRLLRSRISKAMTTLGAVTLADFTSERLQRYLADRLALPADHEDSIGPQTLNHIATTFSSFGRWLTKTKRVSANPFTDLARVKVAVDVRHARGVLTDDEVARLLEHVSASPRTFRGLSGRDRWMLYLVAMATGLRVGELASLTPSSFRLKEQPPQVCLPARLTKGKRDARQPIPSGLVPILQNYLAERTEDAPIWAGTWIEKAAKMLRQDLQEAGIAYVVDDGTGKAYRDFHSLRHRYATSLEQTGATTRERMDLARHKDPRLTIGRYTHADRESLGRVVDQIALPGITPTSPTLTPEQMQILALLWGSVLHFLFQPTQPQSAS